MISKVNVKNFKSIESLSLDCKRINLFVGKPNVGKSNILECLSFFGTSRLDDIRFESVRNLFYDQDVQNQINVKIDGFFQFLRFEVELNDYANLIFDYKSLENALNPLVKESLKNLDDGNEVENDFFKFLRNGDKSHLILDSRFNEQGKLRTMSTFNREKLPNIKKYNYKKLEKPFNPANSNSSTLNHPHGENIFHVLKNNRKLLQEVSDLFSDYGYSLIIDVVRNEAEIQKIVGNLSYKIPYSLVADTLKRIVFYLVAIRTNTDCSIILEEPENNSFPPYIRDIANEIINSKNQFFIATHSPYLLNTIIADANRKEVSINIVSYADYKTHVKEMTDDEISELSNYGIDLFFNLNIFNK